VNSRVFSLFGANNPLAFAAINQGPLSVDPNSCSGKCFFAARLESAILTNLAELGFQLKNTRNLRGHKLRPQLQIFAIMSEQDQPISAPFHYPHPWQERHHRC
jgi:hypothetical protein